MLDITSVAAWGSWLSGEKTLEYCIPKAVIAHAANLEKRWLKLSHTTQPFTYNEDIRYEKFRTHWEENLCSVPLS